METKDKKVTRLRWYTGAGNDAKGTDPVHVWAWGGEAPGKVWIEIEDRKTGELTIVTMSPANAKALGSRLEYLGKWAAKEGP